ncbi:MAG: TIGR01459 family HAD-type hydrolase [Pseudomonadota bacterium]
MTRSLRSLCEVAAAYDAIVLDQWGVLHDGTDPYRDAVSAVRGLHDIGAKLAVLSNSGKRAGPNADRISGMGFPPEAFATIMTSGEALWRDVAEARLTERAFFPIERKEGDAAAWADGLDVTLCSDVRDSEAILLMGLPDDSNEDTWRDVLDHVLAASLPVYCSNPDRASPRSGGKIVVSPGALAHAHGESGGRVRFYGKPHRPVFEAVRNALGAERLLMVGDSLEHDIAGAAAAGWDSVLVTGGLYADRFASGNPDEVLDLLLDDGRFPPPTYMMEALR